MATEAVTHETSSSGLRSEGANGEQTKLDVAEQIKNDQKPQQIEVVQKVPLESEIVKEDTSESMIIAKEAERIDENPDVTSDKQEPQGVASSQIDQTSDHAPEISKKVEEIDQPSSSAGQENHMTKEKKILEVEIQESKSQEDTSIEVHGMSADGNTEKDTDEKNKEMYEGSKATDEDENKIKQTTEAHADINDSPVHVEEEIVKNSEAATGTPPVPIKEEIVQGSKESEEGEISKQACEELERSHKNKDAEDVVKDLSDMPVEKVEQSPKEETTVNNMPDQQKEIISITEEASHDKSEHRGDSNPSGIPKVSEEETLAKDINQNNVLNYSVSEMSEADIKQVTPPKQDTIPNGSKSIHTIMSQEEIISRDAGTEGTKTETENVKLEPKETSNFGEDQEKSPEVLDDAHEKVESQAQDVLQAEKSIPEVGSDESKNQEDASIEVHGMSSDENTEKDIVKKNEEIYEDSKATDKDEDMKKQIAEAHDNINASPPHVEEMVKSSEGTTDTPSVSIKEETLQVSQGENNAESNQACTELETGCLDENTEELVRDLSDMVVETSQQSPKEATTVRNVSDQQKTETTGMEGNKIESENVKIEPDESSNFGENQDCFPEGPDGAKEKVDSVAQDVLCAVTEDPNDIHTSKNPPKEHDTVRLESQEIQVGKRDEETEEKSHTPCEEKTKKDEEPKLEVEAEIMEEKDENETAKTVILSDKVHEEGDNAYDKKHIKEQVTETETTKGADPELNRPSHATVQTPESSECIETGSSVIESTTSEREASIAENSEQKVQDEGCEKPVSLLVKPAEQSEEKLKEIRQESPGCDDKRDTETEIAMETETSVGEGQIHDMHHNGFNVGQDEKLLGVTNSETNQIVKEDGPELEECPSNLASQDLTDNTMCVEEALKDKKPDDEETKETKSTSEVITASFYQDDEEADRIRQSLTEEHMGEFPSKGHETSKEGTPSVESPEADQNKEQSQILSSKESELRNTTTADKIEENPNFLEEKTGNIEASDDQIQISSAALASDEQEHITSSHTQDIKTKASELAKDETHEGSNTAKTTEIPVDQNLLQEKPDKQIQSQSILLCSEKQVQETELREIQEETKEAKVVATETQDGPNATKIAEDISLQQEEPRKLEASKEDEDSAHQSPIAEKSEEQLPAVTSTMPSHEQEQKLEEENLATNENQGDAPTMTTENVSPEKQEQDRTLDIASEPEAKVSEKEIDYAVSIENQIITVEDIETEKAHDLEVEEQIVEPLMKSEDTETQKEYHDVEINTSGAKENQDVKATEEGATAKTNPDTCLPQEKRGELEMSQQEKNTADQNLASENQGDAPAMTTEKVSQEKQEQDRTLDSEPEAKVSEKEIDHAVQIITEEDIEAEKAHDLEVEEQIVEPLMKSEDTEIQKEHHAVEIPTSVATENQDVKATEEGATAKTIPDTCLPQEKRRELEVSQPEKNTADQNLPTEEICMPQEQIDETQIQVGQTRELETCIPADRSLTEEALNEKTQIASSETDKGSEPEKIREHLADQNLAEETPDEHIHTQPSVLSSEKQVEETSTEVRKVEKEEIKEAEVAEEEPRQGANSLKTAENISLLQDDSTDLEDSQKDEDTSDQTRGTEQDQEPHGLKAVGKEKNTDIKVKDEERLEDANQEKSSDTKQTEELCLLKKEMRKPRDVTEGGTGQSLSPTAVNIGEELQKPSPEYPSEGKKTTDITGEIVEERKEESEKGEMETPSNASDADFTEPVKLSEESPEDSPAEIQEKGREPAKDPDTTGYIQPAETTEASQIIQNEVESEQEKKEEGEASHQISLHETVDTTGEIVEEKREIESPSDASDAKFTEPVRLSEKGSPEDSPAEVQEKSRDPSKDPDNVDYIQSAETTDASRIIQNVACEQREKKEEAEACHQVFLHEEKENCQEDKLTDTSTTIARETLKEEQPGQKEETTKEKKTEEPNLLKDLIVGKADNVSAKNEKMEERLEEAKSVDNVAQKMNPEDIRTEENSAYSITEDKTKEKEEMRIENPQNKGSASCQQASEIAQDVQQPEKNVPVTLDKQIPTGDASLIQQSKIVDDSEKTKGGEDQEPIKAEGPLSEAREQEKGGDKIMDDPGKQPSEELKSADAGRNSLSDLLKAKKDTSQVDKPEMEKKETAASKAGADTEEAKMTTIEGTETTHIEEAKEEEKEGEEDEEDENKEEKTSPEAISIVEAKETTSKTPHKKSHGILSGVGSKVKHSISKVKKAITGKSSHPKPV